MWPPEKESELVCNYYTGVITSKCCTTCNFAFFSDSCYYEETEGITEEIMICTEPEQTRNGLNTSSRLGRNFCEKYQRNIFLKDY